MLYSTIGSRKVGAALARQFARSGITAGIANARDPESIEAIAKQLGAQVAAMTLQDAPSAKVMIVAVPFRTHTDVGDQLSDWVRQVVADPMDNDDISPDELMGLMNAAR